MGQCIIKIKDKYFEWSTITDAPITYGMSLEELRDYIQGKYGTDGLRHLKDRLKRVDVSGTSMVYDDCLEDTLIANRAGDGETEITAGQIYELYKSAT